MRRRRRPRASISGTTRSPALATVTPTSAGSRTSAPGARRDGGLLTLVLVDLDGPQGDGVRRTVAAVLQRWTRSIDGVYRVGEDRFALILPGADGQSGQALTERIAERLVDAHPLAASARFGVAQAGDEDPRAVVRRRRGGAAPLPARRRCLDRSTSRSLPTAPSDGRCSAPAPPAPAGAGRGAGWTWPPRTPPSAPPPGPG